MEIKYLDQIDDLETENYVDILKQNDNISNKKIEALEEIYEKTSDEVTLRQALVDLSNEENISLAQKKKILEQIADLDLGEYKRQIADIEYKEFFIPDVDYDALIGTAYEKIQAAYDSMADLKSEEKGYNEDSDAIRELYKDIFNYENEIYDLSEKKIDNLISAKQHELYLYEQSAGDNVDYRKQIEFHKEYTDIKTYLDGEQVSSYCIDGVPLINVELLGRYGKVDWNSKTRMLKLEI